MEDRPNSYKRGYAEGRKEMFEEIVSSFAGKRHEVKCQCESCRVMRLNQSQGEMRRWWGSNDGAGSFSKYG